MAGDILDQIKLSAFRGRPLTGYQEQVFNDQAVLNFPTRLQSVGQSVGYTAIQGYFTVPRPESQPAPPPGNLITQNNNFITTQTGDPLTTQ